MEEARTHNRCLTCEREFAGDQERITFCARQVRFERLVALVLTTVTRNKQASTAGPRTDPSAQGCQQDAVLMLIQGTCVQEHMRSNDTQQRMEAKKVELAASTGKVDKLSQLQPIWLRFDKLRCVSACTALPMLSSSAMSDIQRVADG